MCGQRRASFFPPLADTSHVSPGAEMDGVPVETDQFGEAQAGLNREQQQGVVAAAEPRRTIGHAKDCLDFGAGQEANLPLVVALAWDREHTLDEGAVSGLLEGHEVEEGADGGQTQVTRPYPGASFRFEIGQERADKWRVQIAEGQLRWRLAQPRLREREQQPERVPVGCDRVGADVALAYEALGEVALDQGGDPAAR